MRWDRDREIEKGTFCLLGCFASWLRSHNHECCLQTPIYRVFYFRVNINHNNWSGCIVQLVYRSWPITFCALETNKQWYSPKNYLAIKTLQFLTSSNAWFLAVHTYTYQTTRTARNHPFTNTPAHTLGHTLQFTYIFFGFFFFSKFS